MENSITRLSQSQLILVTGAARSGKSEWAEAIATSTGQTVTYLATATMNPSDLEWQARIMQHQQRRPATWQTISTVIDLASTIIQSQPDDCLLVDSLGTWVANLLDQSDPEWQQLTQDLRVALTTSLGTTILVAEETGWGVVPAYPSGRLFRDRLGLLTRQIGGIANVVYLVTGGHVLNLSQLGQKLAVSGQE